MRAMGAKTAAADGRLAEIAAMQHGVVTTGQLSSVGILRNGVRWRLSTGRLHRVHHGVYAVGHPGLSREGRWMAAVLACRGRDGGAHAGGFLSHLSAAALWRLLPDLGGAVDVAIIGEAGREKRSGVRIHRPRTLEETMTTIRSGIPVTTPGRTVSDLERARPGRGGTTPAQLRRA